MDSASSRGNKVCCWNATTATSFGKETVDGTSFERCSAGYGVTPPHAVCEGIWPKSASWSCSCIKSPSPSDLTFIKALVVVLLTIFSSALFAETQVLYGFRPQVSLTKVVSDRWDMNVFTSTHPILISNTSGAARFPADIQYYFQASPIYKYSPSLNFVFLGYIYQRANPFSDEFVNESRLFQQVIYGTDSLFGRLTHRVRFEERFIHNNATGQTPFSTRLRYQVALLIPLQGSELDDGEFYFNIYNEFYFSLTGARNALYSENWSYAGIGYQSKQYGRVEVGPLVQRSIINQQHDVRYINLLQANWSYNF